MMPKRRTSKKSGLSSHESKPWLPDPKSVIEVKEVQAPAGGPLRIIRTNIVDPYETPPVARKRPSRKRR